MSAEEYFSKVLEHFLAMKEIKKQGNSLKIRRKMFVMLSKGNFVLKLPEERVNELKLSGEGLPYDPGAGKHMKEWVIIPTENNENWINLTQEAMDFAKTLAKS